VSAPLLGSNGRNRTVVAKLYVGKLGNMSYTIRNLRNHDLGPRGAGREAGVCA
jgi:hypothetical protein